MTEFDFAKVEKKWQKKWEERKIFEVSEKSKKPKYYILEMFPYPSGAGLHMGHAINFTITDIFARFKRMQGYNVMYPIGYDSLGLPAENAAIKAGIHPEEYTNKSMKSFRAQQKKLGFSYDMSRLINTADPRYYKWDQWIFLKMYEKNLAYKKKASVNWCPSCKTVIANEQAQGGKCERCKSVVETKRLKQWFLKITDYADELLEDCENLDWPKKTIAMQKNWIGKSHGVEIDFEVGNSGGSEFGVRSSDELGNVVIVHGSPKEDRPDEFPQNKKHWILWMKNQLEKNGTRTETPLMPKPWKPNYENWKKEFEKLDINENTVLVGHSAGGAFMVRWLSENKQKVKKLILVAPSKETTIESLRLKDFCNFEVNKKIKKFVDDIVVFISNDKKETIRSAYFYKKELSAKLINLENKGHFTLGGMKTKEFPELLKEILDNKNTWSIFTTRPDTIFGVTFMVVSAQHERLNELVTEEQKEKVDKFLKSLGSVSEKEIESLEKEGVFTGSYAVNPANGESVPIYAGNFVVADYGAGMVMAVPAHDQRDFEFAKKYGIEIKQVISGNLTDTRAWINEGKLINSDKFNGLNSEKAKEKITDWLIEKNVARKTVNYKLRDWGISRQRYWGTPIPIINCERCGEVPIPESDLPVVLPKKVTFGEGNPLETNEKWIKTKCPKCGGDARRETDTMDTFVNSSWYFLRYCDSNNDKEIFNPKKVDYWCPIDLYVGGAEHACMHLIYARFYTKFLRDIGLIKFGEFTKKLFHQGMLHAADGNKMSKSLGNTIDPIDTVKKYNADSLRLALMSFASPDKDTNWDEKVMIGSSKFITKVANNFQEIKIGKSSLQLDILLNKTIRDFTKDIESLDYRMATIKLRNLFNKIILEKEISKDSIGKFLQMLSLFSPHIAEELWEKSGNKDFVSVSKWPKVDKSKIKKKGQVVGLNDKIVEDVKFVLEKTGSEPKKIYVYVMPFELDKIDVGKIGKTLGKKVEIFAVNDSKKYDPARKSRNAKPGKAGIYLE